MTANLYTGSTKRSSNRLLSWELKAARSNQYLISVIPRSYLYNCTSSPPCPVPRSEVQEHERFGALAWNRNVISGEYWCLRDATCRFNHWQYIATVGLFERALDVERSHFSIYNYKINSLNEWRTWIRVAWAPNRILKRTKIALRCIGN